MHNVAACLSVSVFQNQSDRLELNLVLKLCTIICGRIQVWYQISSEQLLYTVTLLSFNFFFGMFLLQWPVFREVESLACLLFLYFSLISYTVYFVLKDWILFVFASVSHS